MFFNLKSVQIVTFETAMRWLFFQFIFFPFFLCVISLSLGVVGDSKVVLNRAVIGDPSKTSWLPDATFVEAPRK